MPVYAKCLQQCLTQGKPYVTIIAIMSTTTTTTIIPILNSLYWVWRYRNELDMNSALRALVIYSS